MSKPNNPPAFPVCRESESVEGHPVHLTFTVEEGMTLRDYFAAKAMQGILLKLSLHFHETIEEASKCEAKTTLASISYQYADAMLSEREK